MNAEIQSPAEPMPSDDYQWVVHSSDPAQRGFPKLIQETAEGLWQSRGLAWRLFIRNLQGEYRQSLLGWLWIFLPALANAGVWVLLNSSGTVRISQLSGARYAGFVFLGTVLWQAFTDGLMAPMNTLQANRSPLTKLPFPKEVFVLVSVVETGFDFLARALVAVVLLAIAGSFQPLGSLSLLCFWGPTLIVLGMAGGLILAPFGLLYKDVSKSLTMLLPVWMLLTPVIYPLPAPPAANWIVWLNPPAVLIHQGRDAVLPLSATENTTGPAAETRPAELPSQAEPTTAETEKSTEDIEASATLTELRVQPAPLLWPTVFWVTVGSVFAVLGTVWLRVTSPIVIERLAN